MDTSAITTPATPESGGSQTNPLSYLMNISTKLDGKMESDNTVKTETDGIKSEVDSEVKTEVKTDLETEMDNEEKHVGKSEVKTEVKTEMKTEVKTEHDDSNEMEIDLQESQGDTTEDKAKPKEEVTSITDAEVKIEPASPIENVNDNRMEIDEVTPTQHNTTADEPAASTQSPNNEGEKNDRCGTPVQDDRSGTPVQDDRCGTPVQDDRICEMDYVDQVGTKSMSPTNE